MKKILFITVICLMVAGYSTAQESMFNQNDNVVSLGVGFGGTYYRYGGLSGYNALPTFTVGYERCIIGELFNEQSAIGIGGLGGFHYTSHSYWTSTNILVGVRAAFHYAFIDNLDTYAGAITGYNIHSWKSKDSSYTYSGSSGFTYGVFAGARYYFAGPLAAFAEFGYGYTFLHVGISLKF